MAPPDTPAQVLPRRATHATCGLGFFERDGGVVYEAEPDSGAPTDSGVPRPARALSCSTPDGGVVWTAEPEANENHAVAVMLAYAMAAEARVNPARVQAELRTMDRESTSTDRNWVPPGLLFRAPERSVGKFVRIEGAAQEVRENNGETTLTIALDMLGRERIDITYPGIASDRVVNGADVVVYGVVTGSSEAETRRGEQVVPEVTAVHIEPVAAGTAEQQTQRLLRRTRHY
jgi:cytochrome c-type biogenesis protein CcmE